MEDRTIGNKKNIFVFTEHRILLINGVRSSQMYYTKRKCLHGMSNKNCILGRVEIDEQHMSELHNDIEFVAITKIYSRMKIHFISHIDIK